MGIIVRFERVRGSFTADLAAIDADRVAAEAAQAAAEAAQAAAESAQAAAEQAETAAETAETNAETAETNAETAETGAEAARDDARTWAEGVDGAPLNSGGTITKSAEGYAGEALASALQAALSTSVFATTAARDLAIPSPTNGRLAWVWNSGTSFYDEYLYTTSWATTGRTLPDAAAVQRDFARAMRWEENHPFTSSATHASVDSRNRMFAGIRGVRFWNADTTKNYAAYLVSRNVAGVYEVRFRRDPSGTPVDACRFRATTYTEPTDPSTPVILPLTAMGSEKEVGIAIVEWGKFVSGATITSATGMLLHADVIASSEIPSRVNQALARRRSLLAPCFDQAAAAYFDLDAMQEIARGIYDIQVTGPVPANDLVLMKVYRDVSGTHELALATKDATTLALTQIAGRSLAAYAEPAGVDVVTLSESGGSGNTAVISIKWDEFTAGAARTNMRNLLLDKRRVFSTTDPRYARVTTALASLEGLTDPGADAVLEAQVRAWQEPQFTAAPTLDAATGLETAGNIRWPHDDSAGTFAATVSAAWVDYTERVYTHADSGKTLTWATPILSSGLTDWDNEGIAFT